jgi:hypothetical protein
VPAWKARVEKCARRRIEKYSIKSRTNWVLGCAPGSASRRHRLRRCAPPTRWSESTGNFAGETKPEAALFSEEAVLFLLFGLLRSGQVALRRLVGWRDIDNSNSRAHAA